jgi:hypothetical protein
MVTIYY